MDNLLRRHYPKGDLHALADRLGVTYSAVKNRASRLGIVRKINTRRAWAQWQLDYLKRHYADTPTADMKRRLGRSGRSIWAQAAAMGLRKSYELLQESGRRTSRHPNSIAVRFKKGMTPWNKGMNERQMLRSADAIERFRRTQFKPGNTPNNIKPIGYERISKDGYVYIKVSMGRRMVRKHRWVWQQAYGEIPAGYLIMFRDGNKLNCSLDNLELVSRSEATRRQIQSESPERRAARIAKTTEKRNHIIRLDKIRIHFGMEPKSKLVKRW